MQGHAAANLMPVVAANRIGTETVTPCEANGNQSSALNFYGSSFIADATGELVACAGCDTEEIIYAAFDLGALKKDRLSWGLFRDRRPETYPRKGGLLLSEISNADNQYILLLCGLFGGFIFLLREAKGTMGFSALLSRFCKSERMVMLTSVFMGIIIFVDDYLNIMTVGTCMILYLPRKKMTFTRYVELFFAGFADILPVLAILLASFMIKTACGEMGLSEYVINLCVPYMNGATVLSSATCEIDNMSHAVSQLPYVLISAILATAGFLIAGIMGL